MSRLVQKISFGFAFPAFITLFCSFPVPNHGGTLATSIVILDIEESPELVINIPGNSTPPVTSYDLYTPDLNGNSHWNLSLTLLQMKCDPGDDIAVTSGSLLLPTIWCSNVTFDMSSSDYSLTISDVSHFRIELHGLWTSSTAKLVATIYYVFSPRADISENCDCGENFCCSSECSLSPTRSPRCISRKLTCNQMPNCGFPCIESHVDELEELCVSSEEECSDCVRLWVYIVATLGGLFGFGFIIIFFTTYLVMRNKKWKMAKETLRPQLSFVVPQRKSIAESLDSVVTAEEVSAAVYQTLQRLSMGDEEIRKAVEHVRRANKNNP